MNSSSSRRIFTIFFTVLLAAVLVWGISLQLNPTHGNMSNYLFNTGYALLYGVGGIVGIIGALYVTTNISMGKSFLYLGLAQLSYVVGLLIWSYYNVIAKIQVPYPSPADIFFVLYYPLLAVGCWHLLTMVQSHIHMQHFMEVLAIFFMSAIVIVGFISTPDITSGLSVITRVVNLWYPLGDSLLVAISYLAFRAGHAKFQTGILILMIGLLIQVFADIIFSSRTAAQIYWNGDISDILFALSGWTISFSILNLYFDFIASGEEEK